ncbi:DNA-directed primase/polymerase protein-like isoform X2 [Symsagittifera roscoffensis]
MVRRYEPRLSGWAPSPRWKTHDRQREAIQTVQKSERDSIVVAYERGQFGHNGQRRFVTCSASELFFYYFQIPQNQRNHYEVISENKLCKLYFDLEFDKNVNKNKNGVELVELFVELVCSCLQYSNRERPQTGDILYLDSTTANKFSCHLVFVRTVFENNEHCGVFVKHLCDSIQLAVKNSKRAKNDESYLSVEPENPPSNDESNGKSLKLFGKIYFASEIKNLLVRIDENSNNEDLFVDNAVYTKNRNFRMFKSTKLGKSAFLNRSPHCKYEINLRPSDLQFDKQLKPSYAESLDINPELYRTFLDSLITNIDFDPREVLKEDTSSFKLSNCSKHNGYSEGKAIRKPLIENRENGIFLYKELESFIIETLNKRLQLLEIQEVIESEIFFRTCKSIPDSSLVMYELGHTYRYCERIGRFHKSNKVYICVDLDRSVFYQKCFDPDCDGFRGNEFLFPHEMIPWKGFEKELLDDWE